MTESAPTESAERIFPAIYSTTRLSRRDHRYHRVRFVETLRLEGNCARKGWIDSTAWRELIGERSDRAGKGGKSAEG